MAIVGRDCAERRKWFSLGARGVRMAGPWRRGAPPVGPAGPGGPGRPQGRQQELRGKQRSAPWPGPRRWVSAPRSPYPWVRGRLGRVSGGVRVSGVAVATSRVGPCPPGAPGEPLTPATCENPGQGQSPVRMRPRPAPPAARFAFQAQLQCLILLMLNLGRVSPSCSRSQQRKKESELQA